MSKFDKLYAKLPVWLQNTLVSVYGVYWNWARFGGNYHDHEYEYRKREYLNLEGWENYQQGKLAELLTSCANRVKYYRETWTPLQKVSASKGILNDLPLLDKDAIRQDYKIFLQEDLKPTITFKFHTSGTTGTPIESIYALSELRNSLALREVRSANWAGVSFSMPRATISGRLVEPDPESMGPYYRYNSAEKQVYFSAFHIRPDTAQQYVDALWKHNIRWMTGYAVSFSILGKFILSQKIKVPPLKAIITTSEKLTPDMRTIMQEAFSCKVYEEYSTVENALFASECEHGRLHVSPDVALVEILRSDGTPCEPGEVGEVVTTCLMRSYHPLVRFRLGDLAAWDPEPCPCGRSMPVIKEVVGRIEDVVIGPDGRQLVRFHGIFVDQPHVQEGQIIQTSITQIDVKVVPAKGFTDEDTRDIVARVQQRLGPQVHVNVILVNEIPRTSAGKFKAVISKIKQPDPDAKS